jgi:GntR family transcriptional regulator
MTFVQEANLGPGDRLPSEDQLARRYDVSRTTVREALRMLEEERLVYCEHGRGRFISSSPEELLEEITSLHSTREVIARNGLTVSVRVLDVVEEPASAALARELRCEPGTPLVRLERAWMSDDGAVVYSVDVFRRALCPGPIVPERFAGSLLAELESGGDVRLQYSRARIKAVRLPPEVTERIGADANSAWIFLEQLNFDLNNVPQLYSEDYHRGDKFSFSVLRRRR